MVDPMVYVVLQERSLHAEKFYPFAGVGGTAGQFEDAIAVPVNSFFSEGTDAVSSYWDTSWKK